MKIKTLTLGLLTALMFTACGNDNKAGKSEDNAQKSENWQTFLQINLKILRFSLQKSVQLLIMQFQKLKVLSIPLQL